MQVSAITHLTGSPGGVADIGFNKGGGGLGHVHGLVFQRFADAEAAPSIVGRIPMVGSIVFISCVCDVQGLCRNGLFFILLLQMDVPEEEAVN